MNVIQKYFRYRKNLIDQYLKGDMTKREYLQSNFDAVVSIGLKPFKNVDTIEKGLYNYQYFNAMAKDAKSSSYSYDEFDMKNESIERSNYYYMKKDKSTQAVLKLLDYKGVLAYFITIHSKELRGRLFEIVIDDYDMILHCSNQFILNNLRQEGVFIEGIKTSLIDSYVNQKY